VPVILGIGLQGPPQASLNTMTWPKYTHGTDPTGKVLPHWQRCRSDFDSLDKCVHHFALAARFGVFDGITQRSKSTLSPLGLDPSAQVGGDSKGFLDARGSEGASYRPGQRAATRA
jgi:hypothetical protein